MAYEGYLPISYGLVGHSGDYASRTFERKGGTVGQPSPGVSGADSFSLPTVDRQVVAPLNTSITTSEQPPDSKAKPGRTKFSNIILKRG